MAAWPIFKMFNGEGGTNSKYDKQEKARADNPPKFSDDKKLFDNWLYQVSDKFEEDVAIYRSERTWMMALNRWLDGKAARLPETRYSFRMRPFKCLAEMIQVLESQYHDSTQASAARDSLKEHEFELSKDIDIKDFVAEFNSLAQKAKIPEADWKITLWEHILSDLDNCLLEDFEDPGVSHETFCDRITKAVYSKQRSYEKHRRKLKPKHNDSDQTGEKGKNRGLRTVSSNNKPKITSDYKPKTCIATGKPLSEADKIVHWEAGTCFNCEKTGHMAHECPDEKITLVTQSPSSSDSEESEKEQDY